MYLLNNINSTSLFDYSYTYHYSKYSCSTAFYFIHVIFCYIVFLSGLGAFITRLHKKIKIAHQWFGRIYILSMLYATASSLLIHNTGLPLAVLISFAYCIIGLTIAWFLIICHKQKLLTSAYKKVNNRLTSTVYILNHSLKENIDNEIEKILEKRNFKDRVCSFKAFHGIFMFMSWINITGRIFASNQSGDFQCYTYPIYKIGNNTNQLNESQTIEFQIVPEIDPNYNRLPWANNELGWGLGLSLGPLFFGLLVSFLWGVISWNQDKSKENYKIKKKHNINYYLNK